MAVFCCYRREVARAKVAANPGRMRGTKHSPPAASVGVAEFERGQRLNSLIFRRTTHFRQDPLAKDEDLIEAVNSQMRHVQSDPALVRALFDHPAVAYVKQALKWGSSLRRMG
jgi:hypothetical protein